MFVNEFGKKLSSNDLNAQLESVYKWRLNFNNMSASDARLTLEQVSSKIRNIKNSKQGHFAEKTPKFMESLLVSKVLETWINEQDNIVLERNMRLAESARRDKFVQGMMKRSNDFEVRYPGQSQQVMFATAAKMSRTDNLDEAMAVLRGVLSGATQLNESEVDQASAIVAARGMVDEIQKMVEKIGAMVNEDLPSLYDTIRDRVGADQAQAFNTAAQSALSPLMDAVKSAREAMDGAARTVAGEEPMSIGAADTNLSSQNSNSAADMPVGDDVDFSSDSEFDTSDAAAGGAAELGRGKRS